MRATKSLAQAVVKSVAQSVAKFAALVLVTPPAAAFDCVEKKCSEMYSCAEAYHHLTVCGETIRDRDGDGIPCENVCGKTQEEFRRRLGTPGGAKSQTPPPSR